MSGLVRVGEGAPIGTRGLEEPGIFSSYNALASHGEYSSCMLRSAAMRNGNWQLHVGSAQRQSPSQQ